MSWFRGLQSLKDLQSSLRLQTQLNGARKQRQSMGEKRIPVTEAAQRIVDAVDEVVGYELYGTSLRFNFDHPRHVYPSRMISASATIFAGETMDVDGVLFSLLVNQVDYFKS